MKATSRARGHQLGEQRSFCQTEPRPCGFVMRRVHGMLVCLCKIRVGACNWDTTSRAHPFRLGRGGREEGERRRTLGRKCWGRLGEEGHMQRREMQWHALA